MCSLFFLGDRCPNLGDGWFCWGDASSLLFFHELPGGESGPYSVHVGCGVLECFFEAFFSDFAGSTYFPCFGDVADVFVAFGEHVLSEADAVGFVFPVSSI